MYTNNRLDLCAPQGDHADAVCEMCHVGLHEPSNWCVALHAHVAARFMPHSCKAQLISNNSQALEASAVGDELSLILASHPQQSLLHSPRWQ